MVTTFEVLAMLTVVGLGVLFGRRRVRGTSAWAVVMLGFCTALAMPSVSSATEFRKGDSATVGRDENIKGDIYLFGNRSKVEGTVDGDVVILGHDAVVSGHVTGDVISFSQVLQITGQVDGNVRSFVNTLTVTGTVGKSVSVFGDSINLDSNGKIGGSLTTFAGSLSLEGQLTRDLLVFSKHTEISGPIGGGIHDKGETLSITGRASVGGPIWYEGKKEAEVSSTAKLAFPVEYHKPETTTNASRGAYFIWQIIWAAAFVVFGLVLFTLTPQFSGEAVDSAERYGASLGLGVLVCFGVPIAALIACITVVGLFVGISTMFVWYVALYYSQLIVGGLVGQWLLGRSRELWPFIGRAILGVLIVRLCTTIPRAGGWIKFAVIVWGMGAISLALYRRFEPRVPPVATAPVPPSPMVTPQPA
jgi:cytoskeletal protein CcmA (bactofilin family)